MNLIANYVFFAIIAFNVRTMAYKVSKYIIINLLIMLFIALSFCPLCS